MAAVLAAGNRRRAQPHHRRRRLGPPPARRRRHPRHRPRRRRPQTPTRHPHPPQPHAHSRPTPPPTAASPSPPPSAPSSTSPAPSKPLPLEQALDQADRRGLIDFAELKARPIPRSLQAILARYTGPTFTRSELEDRFHALCDTHDLPRPISNTIIEGEDVDFAWRQTAPDRRGRRLRLPPLPLALRERPRTRRDAHPRRLDSPALHLDPSHDPPQMGRPRGRQAAGRVRLTSPRAREAPRWPGRPPGPTLLDMAVPAAAVAPAQTPGARLRRIGADALYLLLGFCMSIVALTVWRHRHHAVAHARAADRRLPGRAAHVRVRALAGGARAPPCRARARRADRRRLPAAARRPAASRRG